MNHKTRIKTRNRADAAIRGGWHPAAPLPPRFYIAPKRWQKRQQKGQQ